MKFTLITAIFLGWLHSGKSVRPQSCCLTVTNTRITVDSIVYYDIQDMQDICPVRAVRFHTKRDKIICSDPDSSWAIRAMRYVNEKRTPTKEPSKEPFVYDTSTANLIPTITTIQRTTTEGDGCPESFCYTGISTTITVKPPIGLGPLLSQKRSRSKTMLRKFQSKIKIDKIADWAKNQ